MKKQLLLMSMMILIVSTAAYSLPCKIEGEILNIDGTKASGAFVQVTNLDTGFVITAETGKNLPDMGMFSNWYNVDMVCSPLSNKVVVEAIKDNLYGKYTVVPQSTLTFFNLTLDTQTSGKGISIINKDGTQRIVKNNDLEQKLNEIKINLQGDIVTLGISDIGIFYTGDVPQGLMKNFIKVMQFFEDAVRLNISDKIVDISVGEIKYLEIDDENITIKLNSIKNGKATLSVIKVIQYPGSVSKIEERLEDLKESETPTYNITINKVDLNWIILLAAALITAIVYKKYKKNEKH